MTTQTKKKVSSKIVALLLTALLLLTMVPVGLLTTVFAAGTEFTVAVTDAEEKPSALEGATVTLTPTDETLQAAYTYSTVAAADGMAVFADLTAAMDADETLSVEFQLTVSKNGYQTAQQTVTVNKDNKTDEISVQLVQTFAVSLTYNTEAAKVTVDGTEYTAQALPVLTKGEHTVKVEPSEGYVLTKAVLNGTETAIRDENTIQLNVTGDVRLGLTLVQQFAITVNIAEDGTVSYNDGVTVTDGGTVYALPGTNNTFKVEPAANYKVASITDNNAPVTLNENGTFTVTAIDKDHTLSVVFTKVTHTVEAYAHIINAGGESNQPNTAYGTVILSALNQKGEVVATGTKLDVPFDQSVKIEFIPVAKSVSNVYALQKFTVNGNTWLEGVQASGRTDYVLRAEQITKDLDLRAYFANVPTAGNKVNPSDLFSLVGNNCELLSTYEKKDANGVVTDIYYVFSKTETGSVWARPIGDVMAIDFCGKSASSGQTAQYFGVAKANTPYVITEEAVFTQAHVIAQGRPILNDALEDTGKREPNGEQTIFKFDKAVHILFDTTAPVLTKDNVVLTSAPNAFSAKKDNVTTKYYNDGDFVFTVTIADAKTHSDLTNRDIDDVKVVEIKENDTVISTAYAGIKSLQYSINIENKQVFSGSLDKGKADISNAKEAVFTVPMNMTDYKTGTYTVTFTATDVSGNISNVYEQQIVIDNTAPTLAESTKEDPAITFTSVNENLIAQTINMLTFGAFCKPSLKAEIKVSDAQSGLGANLKDVDVGKAKMVLAVNNVEYANGFTGKYDKSKGTYTFTYDKADLAEALGNGTTAETVLPLTCSVKFEVVDNVGNVAVFTAGKGNSNMNSDSGLVMIEETAPEVTLPESGKQYKTVEDIFFTAEDEDSGLFQVEVTYFYNSATDENGATDETKAITVTPENVNKGLGVDTKAEKKITSVSDKFQLSEGDGQYDVTVKVTDNAGNVKTETRTYYLDSTAPAVTGFKLLTADQKDEISKEAVEITSYGYYFKENVTLEVSVTDAASTTVLTPAVDPTQKPIESKEAVNWTSGVQAVKYYTVSSAKIQSEEQFTNYTEGASTATIDIPANFKGQIYVMPIDKLGNTPAKDGAVNLNDVYTDEKGKFMVDFGYTDDGYIHPNGTILETQAKHDDEKTHITIEKKDSELTDLEGHMLYNAVVPVTVTVKDTYSGIRTVNWAITSQVAHEGDLTGGTLTVPNQKDDKGAKYKVDDTLTDLAGQVWTVKAVDNNLVTEISATIYVTNNSNNIDFSVNMQDRAGNDSEDRLETFSIDTTAPIIRVEYDNNSSDAQYTDYFKADRTATVTVQERNLDLVSTQEDIERVLYEITNTDGVVPQLEGWEVVNTDDANPDNNTYKATIRYTADGDYTFAMSCTDRAGNANADILYGNSVAPTAFTVDKTLPIVTVAYDNNASKTGTNFYDAQRVASITVVEHNFDANRVIVTGLANDDGAAFAFPSTSAWTHNGDTHTATITYVADGKYNFDIAFADMASNGAADYAGDEFYIDNTDPVPSITGTEVNGTTAFNDLVTPQISCTDKNIDVNRITVTLRGTDKYGNAIQIGWNTGADESMSEDGNTKSYTLNCLNEKINNAFNKLFDGDYTLRVEMTDLAGRTASAEKSFSVNRFGSDYKLTAPQDVNGQYVTSTGDFVIEEINVNALVEDSIVLTLFTADSAGRTLKLNEDYSYERDGKINRYTIFAKNFTNDSVYTLTIYSKDAAGNQNDSTDESKKMTIEFVVDKIAPIITSETLDTAERDNNKPKAASMDAVFAVTDNHELNVDTLKFTVNGDEVQYTVDAQGKYHITLNESRAWQKVSVTVLDTAGNAAETVEAEALVSTNIFVRWFNNTPVFIGSLVGVVAVAAILIVLVVKRKKRDEE